MLKHHADPGGDGGLTVGDDGLLAVDEYFPFVGFVKPIQNGHQRGFARAVFPDNTVDRAGHDPDGNILVRLHRAKSLGDAAQFNRWRCTCHLDPA